jgi:DNA-directed RNA polymerase subunit RPC12/RpoP
MATEKLRQIEVGERLYKGFAKRTVYCECSQRSLLKPISETEYECFDCGKEVKQ